MKNARRDAATADTGGGVEPAAPDNGQDATEVDGAHASELSGVPVEPDSEAIKRLEAELDEARDQHLRLAAEFDNYRKRVARERTELTDKAQAGLVARLLDALDDTDRLTATMGTLSVEALREAVTLVDRKFWKELEAAGLEAIDPVGKPFDPSLHEAVSVLAPPSPEQDHTVAATFQIGYRFKGTLVRPARVQVYSEQGQA
ncbi:MAG: nucleotide exchange factor GrpE [Gemmatimonadales bacterium]